MTSCRLRRAFTLVELLVVSAIMAVLFGLILSGARPSVAGQTRQAAQALASALMAAQSRALGEPLGAAVLLEPGGGGAAVVTVSNGQMLPWITGTTGTTGMPPTPPSAATATVTLAPLDADAEDLLHSYKIRLSCGGDPPRPCQPSTAWLALSVATAASGTASGAIGMRSLSGQTPFNTVWPVPTTSAMGPNPFDFVAARYPAKGETAAELSRAAAIDLRFSGTGDDPTTTWGGLAGKGAVAIVFDSVGGLESLMQQVLKAGSRLGDPPPLDPTEPVYLFVAPRADIESGGNTLANQDAVWVVIHPQTGRVSVGNNLPQTATDATALRAARTNARALTLGGK